MSAASLFFDQNSHAAVTIHPVRAADWDKWSEGRPAALRTLASAYDFRGQAGRILLSPATDGATRARAVAGDHDPSPRSPHRRDAASAFRCQ